MQFCEFYHLMYNKGVGLVYLYIIIGVTIAIYAYVIVKDNVSDDEESIIDDLKMAIKQHIGSFAVPHCFMVTTLYV